MKSNSVHITFVIFLFFLALITFIAVGIFGSSFYLTPIIERPFHPEYNLLKPSGPIGHGYGIIGSLMITIGVISYSTRKRVRALASIGKIKYFLEFHIFLCLLGPILVMYHTTFKFGGIVAISFWSMTAVVLSGIIGRYIYNQIPKNIAGNELNSKSLFDDYNLLAIRLKNEFGFIFAGGELPYELLKSFGIEMQTQVLQK